MRPTIDWARVGPRAGADAEYRPQIFRAGHPDDQHALARLVDSGAVVFAHDTLREQLVELLETREPRRKLGPDELERRAAQHLAGRALEDYGTWVFYPWSARLVHVLPEAEYRELRTSRNRNKITAAEQRTLGGLRVGVVGLSVGQATAVTLALEGVGGEFRLADFDALSLSNMNRLRAGAHEIGVHKGLITAREIYEIDPYVRVVLYPRGLDDANLPAFLAEGGRLDLLFEECDDLKMKVRVRERAREAGIPVLMETSDRGLIDVERFDREPDRPLFHGLVGPLDADKLSGMSTYDKVPIVLKIIGADTMSRRMAASLVDIDSTLKTWPQLASAVALGGAINTDAARRIALGTFRDSGRYFVDVEQIVRDGGAAPTAPTAPPGAARPAAAPARPARPASRAPELPPGEPLTSDDLHTIVTCAALAPSGGNVQPWRFAYHRGGRLRCVHDVERSRSFLDFRHLATYAAFGAAAENIALASRALGLPCRLEAFPDRGDLLAVCDASFDGAREPPRAADAGLIERIQRRATNRKRGAREPMREGDAAAMAEAAAEWGGRVHFVADDARLAALGEVLGEGDRIRFLSTIMHREMMGEIRWSDEAARATRDGLDLPSLELTPTDLAGLRLTVSPSVMDALRLVGGGKGLGSSTRKSLAAASAVALVTVDGRTPRDYFRGGRALQRAWLAADELGYAVQPMTALVYMFARLEQGGGVGFSASEYTALIDLRRRYMDLFAPPEGSGEIILFLIGRAGPPTARSLRRPLKDILTVED